MFSKLKQRAAIALKGISQITINNRQFEGSNISVVGNKVIVDGIQVDMGDMESLSPIIITVTGDVDSVSTQSGDVTVKGDVLGTITTQSGDIEVAGNCGSSIGTMSGDVDVGGNCTGNVSTMSGDVTTHPSKPNPPARRPEANYW